MKSLLVIREQIKMIYAKYEFVITPVYKFLLAFISILMINSKLGYFEKIDNIPIALVAGLFCSFMPVNVTLIVDSVFILLHMYTLSLAAAIVVGILLLLLLLLYFRFSPKYTQAVIYTPMLFVMKIPYILPIVCGLLCAPTAAISVIVGIILFFVLKYVQNHEVILSSAADDSLIVQFRLLIDGLLKEKTMLAWIMAFAITLILVYVIRRLSINYAWTIAMIAGALLDMVILFVGALVLNIDISFVGALLGSILAVAVAKIFEFFFFNVDYNRTEYVQYEDDEYYYYVKAVPKNVVAKPEKSVKKVSSATRQLPVIERSMMENKKTSTTTTAQGAASLSKPAGSRTEGTYRTNAVKHTASATSEKTGTVTKPATRTSAQRTVSSQKTEGGAVRSQTTAKAQTTSRPVSRVTKEDISKK